MAPGVGTKISKKLKISTKFPKNIGKLINNNLSYSSRHKIWTPDKKFEPPDKKNDPPTKKNDPPEKWSTEEKLLDKTNELIFYKCLTKKIIFLLYL